MATTLDNGASWRKLFLKTRYIHLNILFYARYISIGRYDIPCYAAYLMTFNPGIDMACIIHFISWGEPMDSATKCGISEHIWLSTVYISLVTTDFVRFRGCLLDESSRQENSWILLSCQYRPSFVEHYGYFFSISFIIQYIFEYPTCRILDMGAEIFCV